MSSTSKKKPSKKATMMSNQDANVDGKVEEVSGSGYPQTHTYRVRATDLAGSTSNVSSQIYTYTTTGTTGASVPLGLTFPTVTSGHTKIFSPPQTYPMYWGDDRRSIPHHCRCNASMDQPHEDHIYIKRMWFCSIKCYQEWMVACIGESIDE